MFRIVIKRVAARQALYYKPPSLIQERGNLRMLTAKRSQKDLRQAGAQRVRQKLCRVQHERSPYLDVYNPLRWSISMLRADEQQRRTPRVRMILSVLLSVECPPKSPWLQQLALREILL